MLISDLGEQALLKLIQPYCLPNMIGDDGAILRPPIGYELVVTTDILVDGVHFSDRTTSPFDVGWRSVAANLSDLAAMGATPLGITVGLSLPPSLPVVWLEQLYLGMQACLAKFGTGIVGGDLTRSSVITVAITALGGVKPDQVIARSTAQVNDSIIVTGYHGDAHGGLQLLLDSTAGQNAREFTTAEDFQIHRQKLITAHQRPQPRLDILPLLAQLRTANHDVFAVSGMDSSDGLADAIDQICRSSGVGATLTRSSLPISPALSQLFPHTALSSALSGGEDFELVLCLPPSIALELMKLIGAGAAIVGKVTRSPEIILIDDLGRLPPIQIDRQAGFQHF